MVIGRTCGLVAGRVEQNRKRMEKKMADGKAKDLYNKLKLTRSWLKEHGTPIVTCGGCGRWLTEEAYKKHKEEKENE